MGEGFQSSERAEEHTALLAAIVESSDDAIVGKTLDGNVTSWNRGAEAMFGYSASEMLGRPLTVLFPAERVGEEQAILARIGRGERIEHFDTVRIRKDGTAIDVAVTISPIVDAKGHVIGAAKIARDISERKRTLAALTASERQYRVMFQESPLPKWIFDVKTLKFLATNRAAQEHYGYSEAEFLARTIRDIRPPEDLPALAADILQAHGTHSRSGEWRHRKKDGTIIHVQVHAHDVQLGENVARLVVAQDITERKLAETRLRAQLVRLDLLHRITRAAGERQDLRSIFQVVIRSLEDNLPLDFCCIGLYDPPDPRIRVSCVGFKSAALALELAMPEQAFVPIDENGLSRCVHGFLVYEPEIAEVKFPFPERLVRGGLHSLVAAPLLVESKVFGVLVAARREPQSFSSGECEFLKQLCEHVALAAHQAELHGALQQAYDDLRQTQQAIMQQERLRSLGQMASGIAHDINNAISPATLYTESLLEQEPNLTDRGREQLAIVQHALEDVAQTVARMREFYRQREPELTLSPVNLNQLAQQVIGLTRARWHDMPLQRGTAIDLQTELREDLPAIMGVESEIREALINLVLNAADAMPEGGRLALRTQVIGGGDTEATRYAQITVSDTGVGMDEETRKRCLEPFFTTKGDRGTGLGLAMVYGMVRRHSAELAIESAPGQGTEMKLSFAIPVTATDGAEPRLTTSVPSRLRLLIVDDDPLLIKSLHDTLELDGHSVVTANDGQSGIDTFRLAHGRKASFDAVITDLGMPHIDGRKVAIAIKTISPATPVIMLTGWGQRLVAEGDVPPHVDQVLSKPPKLRELRETLARLCSPVPP
ncbi:MAG TPA: PAS domain S-box protein [Opitutaceae bacterium]|jgi:PAS domain S-box-containing protein